MKPADFLLLGTVAEPKARRRVAAEFFIPSGAIPVLAAVAFRDEMGDGTHTSDIYAVKIAAPTLVRYYISALLRAGLVNVSYQSGRAKILRPSMDGRAAMNSYKRELTQGCKEFGHVQPMRVLTR